MHAVSLPEIALPVALVYFSVSVKVQTIGEKGGRRTVEIFTEK